MDSNHKQIPWLQCPVYHGNLDNLVGEYFLFWTVRRSFLWQCANHAKDSCALLQVLEANLHNMVVFFPSCPSFTYVLKQQYLGCSMIFWRLLGIRFSLLECIAMLAGWIIGECSLEMRLDPSSLSDEICLAFTSALLSRTSKLTFGCLLSSTSTIHSRLANPGAPPKYSLLVAVVVVELAFFQSPWRWGSPSEWLACDEAVGFQENTTRKMVGVPELIVGTSNTRVIAVVTRDQRTYEYDF